MNGENRIYYKFRYSEERFERPIKKAKATGKMGK